MIEVAAVYEDVVAGLVLLLSLLILTSNFAVRHFLIACGFRYSARRAVGWTGLILAIAMLAGPALWLVEALIATIVLLLALGAARYRRRREIALSIGLLTLIAPTLVLQ